MRTARGWTWAREHRSTKPTARVSQPQRPAGDEEGDGLDDDARRDQARRHLVDQVREAERLGQLAGEARA